MYRAILSSTEVRTSALANNETTRSLAGTRRINGSQLAATTIVLTRDKLTYLTESERMDTSTPSPGYRTANGRLAAARRRKRAIIALAAGGGLVVVAAATFAFAFPGLCPLAVTSAKVPTAAPSAVPTATVEPVVSQEPTLPPEPSQPATITVAAVGDMIFDRKVKSLVQSAGGLEPLEEVAAQLAAADVAVGNLESPMSDGGTRNTAKDVTFRGDPRGVEGLVAAGFDFLSLANNHVLDYGADALADTVTLLDENGIGHSGAGANRDAAWTPAVVERNGATVAFLSFSHILPAGFVATGSSAGLAQGRNNMDAVEEAIRSAKESYDYVIVSFHWGVEYEDDCNGDQVTDAHRAVDAGADMVMSHHPHVIQAVEYYNGRLIAYSLGDFVFDHYSRKTGEAFILDASLGPSGVSDVTITPVYLDENGKPEYVHNEEATTILQRLHDISAKRGTIVTLDGDIATVTP